MERLKGEGVQDWLSQHLTAPWQGHQTVASELGNDIIANIKERWSQLDSVVRLGVLFSLISLKKAQQLQLKDKCQELIDHACSDPDDWVRLISQMFKDYPTEGILRFNVEQFADQAQLGSLMDELTNHISHDGIKFHPKEFAYLNDSVCKAAQGKDPKTKTYPPITGPSLQQHFNLRESHLTIHTERAKKLKKMAEQASSAAGNLSISIGGTGVVGSAGGPLSATSPVGPGLGSAGLTGTGGNVAAGGSAATAGLSSTQTVPGGPPRPTKNASTGLFVRKPTGSFLRNNPPRPMPIPRNPSTGQLPLRSPRLDGSTTPRLNQKSSRIQILDIQQGNEIMQNMNDEKRRKEEAEQREKELKKEQRALELEAKRQQDAEKKAQVQKEREEKKREREEAKRLKEKQKQDRDEQLRQQRQHKEQDQQQDQDRPRGPDEDEEEEDDEGTLSSLPVRKRTRIASISSSRRGSKDDGDDEDNYEQMDRSSGVEPPSPITTPSRNQQNEQPTPEGHLNSEQSISNSHTPPQSSHQPQQSSNVLADHPTIFQNINLLTPEDRVYIEAFLQGHPMKRPHENESLYQIVMNQEQVTDASGRPMYETILIEMNFDTCEWKKIKRRRAKPHVPTTSAQQVNPSN
ncbi:Negative elongation factor A [Lobosporangium transversale]|nr:Negative elongation factor A [Lobosporangium transversale]